MVNSYSNIRYYTLKFNYIIWIAARHDYIRQMVNLARVVKKVRIQPWLFVRPITAYSVLVVWVLNRELLFLPTSVLATLVHIRLIIPQKLSSVLKKWKTIIHRQKCTYLCQCWQMSKGFQLIHDRATRWTVLDKSHKVGKQSRLHTGYDTLICEKLYESHKKILSWISGCITSNGF